MSKKEKYEDISSQSAPSGVKAGTNFFFDKIKIFFLRNRKRNLKALLSILICIVLMVCALGGAYIRKMLSLIQYSDGHFGDPDATFTVNEDDYDEDLEFATMSDIAAADVKDFNKQWATNGGEKLYSKYVINVLLIGEDATDGAFHSDTMILASVNTKTHKIYLCSLMRDSYAYININGQDRYDKITHAYAWGGPFKVMEIFSDNFKIKIDHYVSINFESFKKAIDLLGGISVPITESEARFMNRTTRVKGFESGDSVNLNGERALIYARIRKLDSDIERTRRQRNVIAAAIQQIKASSISDVNKLIETFLPYITTNFKTSEILSYASQALNNNWLSYEIVGMVQPSETNRVPVNNFRTYAGNLFVWIVDYVRAAREVQLTLYGKTNIEISPDYVSPLDMVYRNPGYTSTPGEITEIISTNYIEPTTEETSTRSGIINWFTTYTNPENNETTWFGDQFTKNHTRPSQPSGSKPSESYSYSSPSTEQYSE